MADRRRLAPAMAVTGQREGVLQVLPFPFVALLGLGIGFDEGPECRHHPGSGLIGNGVPTGLVSVPEGVLHAPHAYVVEIEAIAVAGFQGRDARDARWRSR